MMAQHQQIGEAPPNMPLVPSTSTSPQRFYHSYHCLIILLPSSQFFASLSISTKQIPSFSGFYCLIGSFLATVVITTLHYDATSVYLLLRFFAAACSSPPAPLNTLPTISASTSPLSSNRAQEEHSATLHAIIISLITTVGGYVLFQFQSMKLSLFDEHGNIMRAAFVMLVFYVMALMAEFRLQNESNYFAIMKKFSPLFGLLVVVLLLFLLSLFLGLLASITWAFLAVGPTLRLFQQIIQSLRGIIQYITTDQTATSNLGVEERDPLEIL